MTDFKQYSDLRVYGKLTADSIELYGKYFLLESDGTLNQIIVINGVGQLKFMDGSSLGLLTAANFISGTGTSWQTVGSNIKVNVSLSPFSTTNLLESSNLYYTNTRANGSATTAEVQLWIKPPGSSWQARRPYFVTDATVINTSQRIVVEAGGQIQVTYKNITDNNTNFNAEIEYDLVSI